jgi:deferrochelatase/peroxidase EfeB
VVTTTAVELSPKLLKQLKAKLQEFAAAADNLKVWKQKHTDAKVDLETIFADAHAYDALEAGVKIDTPIGQVSMKMITGTTARKLNITKVLKKFKKTLADLEDCYDEAEPKAAYLGIFLPTMGTEDE